MIYSMLSRMCFEEATSDTPKGAGSAVGGGLLDGRLGLSDTKGSSGAQPPTSDASKGTQTPSVAPEIKLPENWKSALPKELQDDPSMAVINDLPSLAKSYVHAQKLIGADKIAIPSKHATEDDWRQVYHKLGLPKEDKEYSIEFKEAHGFADPNVQKTFKEAAFKAGILPKQAQLIVESLSQFSKSSSDAYKAQVEQAYAKDVDALKQEWGAATDAKLNSVANVLKKHATPDEIKQITESGLANNTTFLRVMAKLAKAYGEDTLPGGSGNVPVMTPSEASKRISSIMGDSKHPYFNKQHPGHAAAVAEMNELFRYQNT